MLQDGMNNIGNVLSTSSSIELNIRSLEPPVPANLHWSGLSCLVVDEASGAKKTILKDCSGKASAGEIVALMGPSGAGRASSLNNLFHALLS